MLTNASLSQPECQNDITSHEKEYRSLVDRVLLKQEAPIYVEKVMIKDSLSTYTFVVDQKPTKAGIDPMNKFVDRDIDDNMVRVQIVSSKEKLMCAEACKSNTGDTRTSSQLSML